MSPEQTRQSHWRTALDTNIVIALIKQREDVLARLRAQPPYSVTLPGIVLQELYFGAYKGDPARREDNLSKVRHLRFDVLDFTPQDAEAAGRIRAELAAMGRPIGPYDALIAAQALTRDLTLVTHNTREFQRVPGLRVEDWL